MKKIVVCDDDTESINYMKKLLENYISARKAQCEILYYKSGKELLEAENIAIDIAVLDVEMDGINGIQTGYEVQKRYPDAILMITTAYMKYLDDAMDLRVFRYFEKPVDRERLFHALDIALREEAIIDIPTKNGIQKIGESSIVCIYAHLRKSVVLTDTGCKIQTRLNIKDWIVKLGQNDLFASPHYSYIVNLNFIRECTSSSIVLQCKNGDSLKIYPSKRKYPDFRNKFYEKMRDYK